ncbi:MAG: hypothetical protein M1820_003681 [Bogoriella megaspora]|nr:MAG: hypothetical protein M1820_003681 [Bogoriella megaspora]
MSIQYKQLPPAVIGPDGYLPYPYSLPRLTPWILHGLKALTFFAFLSIISTVVVLGFILHRVIKFRDDQSKDISRHQPVILIINLLVADLFQALAAAISLHWIHQGSIMAPSHSCTTQGLLLQLGVVSSGLWVLAIAVVTWLRVVRRKSLGQRTFYWAVGGIWLVGIILTFAGLMAHPWFFASIGPSCWISLEYRIHSVYLLTLWVFLAELLTVGIYGFVFFRLRKQLNTSGATLVATTQSEKNTTKSLRNLVLFPVVYIALTLPLCVAMALGTAGRAISETYAIIAGVLATSTGWVDCILYTFTRKQLFYSMEDGGANPFSRMLTTVTKNFGGSGENSSQLEPSFIMIQPQPSYPPHPAVSPGDQSTTPLRPRSPVPPAYGLGNQQLSMADAFQDDLERPLACRLEPAQKPYKSGLSIRIAQENKANGNNRSETNLPIPDARHEGLVLRKMRFSPSGLEEAIRDMGTQRPLPLAWRNRVEREDGRSMSAPVLGGWI